MVENKVVGFASYGICRDDDLVNTGEIFAMYVLRVYQKQGIDKQLMNACLEALKDINKLVVWV
ncbi:MAG: GNAT family N-acetyltransferase [Bacilli bacterium]|nr:GNAT family N-acetyltransferase [Bacilli bacterium]